MQHLFESATRIVGSNNRADSSFPSVTASYWQASTESCWTRLSP